jgi:hypothetical protein
MKHLVGMWTILCILNSWQSCIIVLSRIAIDFGKPGLFSMISQFMICTHVWSHCSWQNLFRYIKKFISSYVSKSWKWNVFFAIHTPQSSLKVLFHFKSWVIFALSRIEPTKLNDPLPHPPFTHTNWGVSLLPDSPYTHFY